jgi:aryl-alcohol dehydrogenase-like predicted oxidoreductase
LHQSVNDTKAFMAYVDARGVYLSMRENLFYDAGFEHGLLAARQDNLVERIASDPVARGLLAEINQLPLTTELPRNRVVMLMLEELKDELHRRDRERAYLVGVPVGFVLLSVVWLVVARAVPVWLSLVF